MLAIDKLDKIGAEEVKKELQDFAGVPKKCCDEIIEAVMYKGSNQEKINYYTDMLGNNEGLVNLKKIFDEVDDLEFTPFLARGFAYYTGTIYEFFLMDTKAYGITSSVGSGGRYDKMIGDFIDDGQEYPAVGISFGLDVISDILKIRAEKEKETRKKTVVEVYVISIGCFDDARKIVKKFRDGGIKTDMDLLERGVSKNLDYASKAGIRYVAIVGKKEIQERKVKLKDMISGEEKLMTVNDCFKFLNGVC